MTSAVRWLRISYWVGAIVDLAAGVQMLCPPLFAFGMGLEGFHPGSDYRYAMGMGASLMFGWTALLLWADRRPIERMGVLPLTVVPVIAGMALNEAAGVGSGFLSVAAAAPIWALQAVVSALFLVSYGVARRTLRTAGGRAAA
jgi:hypothetical protein